MSYPTKSQEATIALLDELSVDARWRVDAAAIDADAHERCADDSDHGWATVYGVPGDPDGYCPRSAARYVELAHSDPHWSGDLISLDILRAPGERP
jgi:hypothetical protein